MESKLDRIMAVIHEMKFGEKILGPKEVEAKIAAILAEPDVIVKDGVKWEREQYNTTNQEGVAIAHHDGSWAVYDMRARIIANGHEDDQQAAIRAATAAIKGDK
jgi:hypothetical protein